MGDKERGPDTGDEAGERHASEDLAALSARMIAEQATMMGVMTAFGMQVAGAFMGAMANALEKSGEEVRNETNQPAEPVAASAVKAEEKSAVRPKARKKKTAPKVDDLKKISGIGPRLEKVLNGMGIATFADIAKWTDEDVLKMDGLLGLDNRIVRDQWVKQAKALLEG